MIFPNDKMQRLSLPLHRGALINLGLLSETEYKKGTQRRKIIIYQ